jgi:hypothetical protein
MNPKIVAKLHETFKKELGKFQVCDLGSCQYQTVQATFEFALAYLRHDRAAFEEELGITYSKELTYGEFIEILQKEEDVAKAEDRAEDIKNNSEEDEDYYFVPRFETIEDWFEYARDKAWDLWSAAAIPLLDFKMAEYKIDAPKTGFLINDMITESESFPTGIYLAYITFLFDVPMDAYAHFST